MNRWKMVLPLVLSSHNHLFMRCLPAVGGHRASLAQCPECCDTLVRHKEKNPMTTTMTATGEVTIPESVRAAAGLTPGAPLEISASNGGVLIKEARVKNHRPLTME